MGIVLHFCFNEFSSLCVNNTKLCAVYFIAIYFDYSEHSIWWQETVFVSKSNSFGGKEKLFWRNQQFTNRRSASLCKLGLVGSMRLPVVLPLGINIFVHACYRLVLRLENQLDMFLSIIIFSHLYLLEIKNSFHYFKKQVIKVKITSLLMFNNRMKLNFDLVTM